MAGSALKVLEAMRAAAEAHPSLDLPVELLDSFDSQLAEYEPFRSVHHGWARTQGGGRTGRQLSSHWAWRQFLRGAAPGEVLASATHQVAQNSYELLEVHPIYGLKIAQRFDLSSHAYLSPISELPKTQSFAMAFQAPSYAGLPPMWHDGSALVFRIKIDPAITMGKTKAEPDTLAAERGKTRLLLKHALPLLIEGAIEMPSQYTDVAVDTLLASAGGTFLGGGQPVVRTMSWLRDPHDLPKLMRSIEAMASGALILSIDRLMTSRLKERLEDKILDLGMAAEIALMHEPLGSGDGKGEITAKISSRGAWLIGSDGSERVAISKELKALYGARSKVAHTGRADEKMMRQLPSFDKLVVRILRELLRREAFPEWTALVLGTD